MMDNEQPRQPPLQPAAHITPKITAQVPEVTLFSPSTNKLPANSRPNILQRMVAGNKVTSVQQSPPMIVSQVPMTKQQCYGNSQQQSYGNSVSTTKPSVPDLSLFDPQQQNLMTQRRPSSSPSNLVYKKPPQVSNQNVLDTMGKHSVPDVTILEDPKAQRAKSGSSGAVFDDSYKNMLMNTHNEFMKQFRAEHPKPPDPEAPKRFSAQPKYQANPLMKYAPKPVKQATVSQPMSPDLSSALRGLENESDLLQESDEKIDEITFKKVNAMLSEIQKLVIDKTTAAAATDEKTEPTKPSPRRSEILRRLALKYLTPDEIREFEVEDELIELENGESEDSS